MASKQEMRELVRQAKSIAAISYPADLYYAGEWDGFFHMQQQQPVYCKDEQGNETRFMSHYGYIDHRFTREDATAENLAFTAIHHLSR